MNLKSLARLIRSFREHFLKVHPFKEVLPKALPFRLYSALFFFLLLFSMPFLQSSSSEVKTLKDLPPETLKEIEETVKSFQEPLKKEEYQGIILRTEEEVSKSLNQGSSLRKVLSQNPEKTTCQGKEINAVYYYFFSFSMPEEVILRTMREAVRINRDCEEEVTLVLRGFVKNDLKATVSQLYRYLQKIGDDIPIEIDPELFKQFDVREVPLISLVRNGNTGLIKGDLVGLDYAISRFAEGLKDYGTYGKTYPIGEEDILRVFASKQKEIEKKLRERLPEIKKRMLVLTKYDGRFEHAKKERVYYINPKLILTDDVLDHQGNILFEKGMVFDPSRFVRLGRYIVIDGNSKKQVKFALKGDFKKIILISGDLEKLTTIHRRRFYFANDELIERFKIERVPAVIEGDGEYVRVTEKAL